jgi:hypothetical protein
MATSDRTRDSLDRKDGAQNQAAHPFTRFMRTENIYVQDSETGLLLDTQGSWTSEETRARSFPSAASAVGYCVYRGIIGARLMVRFDRGPRQLMRIPLSFAAAKRV